MYKTNHKTINFNIHFKKALLFIAFQLYFCQFVFSQWNLIPTGTSQFLYGEYFLNNDTGFVYGEYVILKTTDGGLSWSSPSVQNLSRYAAMTFVNNDIGFIVGTAGTILKSIDGGDNWFTQNSPVTELLYSLYFIDSLHGIIVGDDAVILKTSDGGNSWVQIQSPYLFGDPMFYYELRTVQFISDSVGFAAGGPTSGTTGIVIKTNDGGITWNTIFQSYNFPVFLQMEFVNDSTAFASGSCHVNNPFCYRSRVLKSTDQGNSWSEIYFSWAYELRSIDVIGSKIYSVGYDTPTIVFSNDTGATWNSQNPLTLTFPYQVFFTDSLTAYIVGDSGKVLKTINGGVGWQELGLNNSKVTIYPNPSSGIVNIKTEKFSELIEVKIFDIKGDLINSINKFKNNNTEINLTSLARGIYFARIILKDSVVVQKVILH